MEWRSTSFKTYDGSVLLLQVKADIVTDGDDGGDGDDDDARGGSVSFAVMRMVMMRMVMIMTVEAEVIPSHADRKDGPYDCC